jgi:predicted tellurium resistance membrane protein TerC
MKGWNDSGNYVNKFYDFRVDVENRVISHVEAISAEIFGSKMSRDELVELFNSNIKMSQGYDPKFRVKVSDKTQFFDIGDAEITGQLDEGLYKKYSGAALVQIMIADITMSLDNVLAVAGAAHDHPWIMVFGLVLSIALMGVAATFIANLLTKHRWIGYVGLVIVLYVAVHMIWDGARSVIVRTDRMDAFNASAPAFLDISEEEKAKYLKGVRGEEESAAPVHGVPVDPAPDAPAVPTTAP